LPVEPLATNSPFQWLKCNKVQGEDHSRDGVKVSEVLQWQPTQHEEEQDEGLLAKSVAEEAVVVAVLVSNEVDVVR
jgi:hypothetical protein